MLWKAACQYFEWADANPWIKIEQLKKPVVTYDDENKPTVHSICELPTARPYTVKGFCVFCGASSDWWNRLKAAKESAEDFSRVISRIDDIIYTQKFEGAAVGAFNANIISRDLGLTDKKELSGEIGVKQITGLEVH